MRVLKLNVKIKDKWTTTTIDGMLFHVFCFLHGGDTEARDRIREFSDSGMIEARTESKLGDRLECLILKDVLKPDLLKAVA